jgi:hypothetical protein
MELLEKYLDHPAARPDYRARDGLDAPPQRRGWTTTTIRNAEDAEIAGIESEGSDSEAISNAADGFEDHSLYRAAFALTVWIDQLFDENSTLQVTPRR